MSGDESKKEQGEEENIEPNFPNHGSPSGGKKIKLNDGSSQESLNCIGKIDSKVIFISFLSRIYKLLLFLS